MSVRSQHKGAKKRKHESLDAIKKERKHNISKFDAESRSSSCGSKKSNKMSLKDNKYQGGFYNVDRIIGMKIHQGKTCYKVRWQGYSEKEDSWEPEDNLMNVLDLIEEFMNENGKGVGCTKSRTIGGYEYVPSNEIVACKTKFFDDVRDGKIDLTKNDLYSRVKTRKRLQSDTVESNDPAIQGFEMKVEECVEEESRTPGLCDKTKYYQVNLFEMTAEFIKSTTLASKSSTNDDISSFSVSPHTNQSDDILPQSSPIQQQLAPPPRPDTPIKVTVATQTLDMHDQPQSPEIVNIDDSVNEHNSEEVKCKPKSTVSKRLVTSESHLLSIYTAELKIARDRAIVLPHLQRDSDLVSIISFDDLKTAIILNKYDLLNRALKNGVKFDWERLFVPEQVSALQLAVSRNQCNMVRLLLRHGAPADSRWSDESVSESALMLAASCGYVHVVRALLEWCRVDQRGHQGKTALYHALENGRVDVAHQLMAHGTNWFLVTDTQSASALIHDLELAHRLSPATCLTLLSLIDAYHRSFINSLNRTVARYLARHSVTQSALIVPHQWISVLEPHSHIDFLLHHSLILDQLHTPILLLVHGRQADNNFQFWLDNDCCCVDSVSLNDNRQSSLTTSNFVTTLWPLQPNKNTLTVHFNDAFLLSQQQRQIRVAIVAISVTGGGHLGISSTTPHSSSHSRHYH